MRSSARHWLVRASHRRRIKLYVGGRLVAGGFEPCGHPAPESKAVKDMAGDEQRHGEDAAQESSGGHGGERLQQHDDHVSTEWSERDRPDHDRQYWRKHQVSAK